MSSLASKGREELDRVPQAYVESCVWKGAFLGWPLALPGSSLPVHSINVLAEIRKRSLGADGRPNVKSLEEESLSGLGSREKKEQTEISQNFYISGARNGAQHPGTQANREPCKNTNPMGILRNQMGSDGT